METPDIVAWAGGCPGHGTPTIIAHGFSTEYNMPGDTNTHLWWQYECDCVVVDHTDECPT